MSSEPSRGARKVLTGVALIGASASSLVRAEESGAEAAEGNQVERVVITGARIRTSAVTGLDMSLRETPQSVTLVDQERIKDFALTDVNQLLAQVCLCCQLVSSYLRVHHPGALSSHRAMCTN